MKNPIRKNVISLLLYTIVLLSYAYVKDYEIGFIWAAWTVGHFKEFY